MESDDQALCCYGTPLEPLDKDEIPSKKPIAVEDQIVTDENGKRRFHGAFTGGFSAGFWNTVGSLEGWTPQSFKSSRTEKAEKRQSQLPTDFMDEEDLGEFGIAPQRIQARDDFVKDDVSSSRKRKWNATESGPIPGVPLLHQLLEPKREKVAIRLLKKMGWKPGQGIGARQTKREKLQSNKRNSKEIYLMKMYGCTLPDNRQSSGITEDTDELSDDEIDEEITFAPDDFEQCSYHIKDNTFGLGYSGLERGLSGNTTSHINLFASLDTGKKGKKLTISGQAFGVGALEEEDEDIYAKDDMSKYDFSLNNKENSKTKKQLSVQSQHILEGFTNASSNSSKLADVTHRIDLNANFRPRNWLQRKTRFEPLSNPQTISAINSGENRFTRLDPDKRRDILDKDSTSDHKSKKDGSKDPDKIAKENFLKSVVQHNLETDVKKENQTILAGAKQITESLGTSNEVFKPFISNEEKQNRYEMFIKADLKDIDEIKSFLKNIQPIHLSEWEKERELKEFVQARSIYKPLVGLMSDRFVSKRNLDVLPTSTEDKEHTKIKVDIKRTEIFWRPSSVICKRFNIPDPHGCIPDEPKAAKKKNTFSVFDYMESSVNSKKNFVTPTIIPKRIEKPMETLKEPTKTENISKNDTVATKVNETQIISPVTETNLDKATILYSRKKTNAPKTDLEIQIEESRHKHPSEKKDIFKRIFDFSSDEDNDTNDQEQEKTSLPSNVVNTLLKPSVHNNILRNNSPPRGIFASMFSQSLPANTKDEEKDSKIVPDNERAPINSKKDSKSVTDEKITFRSKKERTNEVDSTTYGPKLPENLVSEISKSKQKSVTELLFPRHEKTLNTQDEWIEKESKRRSNKKEVKKKKSKHKKKAKKHKDKK